MDYLIALKPEHQEHEDCKGTRQLVLAGLCFTHVPMHVPDSMMTDEIRNDERLEIAEWPDYPTPPQEKE